MIHTFRDPRAIVICATCGKPLRGVPMDLGDFLHVYPEAEHPHAVFPEQEQGK